MLIQKSHKDKTSQEKIDDAYEGVVDQLNRNGVTDYYEGEQEEKIKEFFHRGFFIGAYKVEGDAWIAFAREKKNKGLIYVPGRHRTYVEFESPLMTKRESIQYVQRLVDMFVRGKIANA